MKPPLISTEIARHLFLGEQGLLADPARKATPTTLAKLIEQMGFVQLDSINYVECAHHLTLGSRLDGYRPKHFTRLLEKDRHLFEHWTHDASVIPTVWFAHWKPRFAQYETKLRNRWWGPRMGAEPELTLAHVCASALRRAVAFAGFRACPSRESRWLVGLEATKGRA